MTTAPTEKQLQGLVIDFWRVAGFPGTRVAAIPNQRAFGQPGLTKGLPDLLFYGGALMPKGHVKFIELKTENGRLSTAQQVIRDEMAEAGVHVHICRSFEEAHDTLVAWRICRPTIRRVEAGRAG